jgi:peptidoglycan hydrolase-like protein with peptidoglycan-binding domain
LISYVVVGIGTGFIGYWAASNAVIPPDVAIESHAPPAYTVGTGTVARALSIPVAASWIVERTLYAGRDGILTSVLVDGGNEVSEGSVIVTIDLQPTVIARGSVPMFRTLRFGMLGPDVAQLQGLLGSLGLYEGEPNGNFDAATEAAVKAWQQSIGISGDGSVALGSMLFVETLPAIIKVLPAVGQRVGAGSDFVELFAQRPEFEASVGVAQRAELTSGDAVSIEAPNGRVWTGVLESFMPAGEGRITVRIGGGLCGADCASLAIDETASMTGSVVLVPATSGPVVPTSAIVVQPSGNLGVTLADGTIRQVRIVAEADGFAVVDGVGSGTVILLPGPIGP